MNWVTNTKSKFSFLKTVISLTVLFLTVNLTAYGKADSDYSKISKSHPRIFITAENKPALQEKTRGVMREVFDLLINRVRHQRIPGRMKNIRDYIYKHGYLYQMTNDPQWAEYAVTAMDKIPEWLKAYGGANVGYAYALEGLAIGFDWCYDYIVKTGKKDHFISMINSYWAGNQKNLSILPDYHNYASGAELAMALAGLSTYGDNPQASTYLNQAQAIMENGVTRNGIIYKVLDSIKFVDGACNWEGPTYGRIPLFDYAKYAEAWNTSTAGKINPWKEGFDILENAGHYIMYSVRPDNKFEKLFDVSYPGVSYYDLNNLALLESVFKTGYFTEFIDRYYRWDTGSFKSQVWLGKVRSPLIYYLLWYDPDLAPKDLEELPKAKKFGDVVIMRSGFDEDDTFVSFKSGIHWGFHSQLDHGSFTIYKHSPLAIDSGYYDGWRSGKLQNWSYWKRTVAHNTLLIYDPQEKWPEHPRGNKCLNDGGQRMVFRSFFPPHKGKGATHNPQSIDHINKHWKEFKMGEITDYEFSSQYDYIRSDLTKAYSNEYSGKWSNQPRKTDKTERQLLYLHPDVVVVYDQISTLHKKFITKWLLHSGDFYDKSGKPEFNGREKIVEGDSSAGIAESTNTDLITLVEGEGKLWVKSLLPHNSLVRRIGGSGYEFWVDGQNAAIKVSAIPKDRSKENPGAWRVEIQPVKQSRSTEFLNVLIPTSVMDTSVPLISALSQESDNFIGLQISHKNKNWVIIFNQQSPDKFKELVYFGKISDEATHIIIGLEPKAFYRLEKNNAKGKQIVTIRKSSRLGDKPSKGGIILFSPKEKQ
jgi:heparinase II/III-like protein